MLKYVGLMIKMFCMKYRMILIVSYFSVYFQLYVVSVSYQVVAGVITQLSQTQRLSTKSGHIHADGLGEE